VLLGGMHFFNMRMLVRFREFSLFGSLMPGAGNDRPAAAVVR